jgi:hypothetical protein
MPAGSRSRLFSFSGSLILGIMLVLLRRYSVSCKEDLLSTGGVPRVTAKVILTVHARRNIWCLARWRAFAQGATEEPIGRILFPSVLKARPALISAYSIP